MRRLQIALATLLACTSAAGKTVEITDPAQVTEVACKIRFTTTIVLPPTERILDWVAGDTATWQVSGAANVTYVKPSVEASETNVTLVTESGRIYFFLVREVSEAGTDPDLQVWVRGEEALTLGDTAENDAGPPHEPMFVGRDEVAEYAAAAKAADARARAAHQLAEERVASAVDEFRSSYPTLMRFEYRLDRSAGQDPFMVTAMWHDGRFTYARSAAAEAPALYEEREGSPSLVGYDLTPDGLFVVRRVLQDGWFQVGKRRAKWTRVVPRLPAAGKATLANASGE